VVAVNRPGHRKAGTVGAPLPGLTVGIESGEIVVQGPTVMRGYLNNPAAGDAWRTGDLGELDSDGHLRVTGRKDNLLVTAFGRNVSPEWIEAMLLADPKLGACAVLGHGDRHPGVLLIPSPIGEAWLARLPRAQVQLWIEQMCAEAPVYAVPKAFAVCTAAEARRRGLLTANGRIVRAAAEGAYREIRKAIRLVAA
jgi:long-subunit acyl-CoA synthetase (AMP-forming)